MTQTSRHLLDPELLPMLDGSMDLGLGPDTLAASRAVLAQLYAAVGPIPAQVSHHAVTGIDGAPDIAVMIHSPPASPAPRPALFYIHGGGMVLGDAQMREGIDGARALAWNCVIVSVDYRLAPETPFPGPVDDCYAALCWTFDHAAELGIDPARIALMGDSAGGGLAASLALLARDRGGPQACAQVLVYPMLDHRTGGDADPYRNPFTGEFGWTHAFNRFGWSCLRGEYSADDARAGHFSASLATDLSGLPPAAIFVGTLDLFFDEDLDYARRLCVSGVPAELHCYPGAPHGFDLLPGTVVFDQFNTDLTRSVTRLLG
jgi:acetyl esterase